ncbi:hypothetical protein TUM19329_13870 [Legionella antarctica]|uniref:DUF5621 domain-containing protein n=1 Tax=Legionella antarctica TaxID=2708020 RepID=A0A6F8T4Y7_9GAMM|nr:DUF5621 domain-containing protein [Legionella antarctica]BCA95026.1 hypothetical protein TUM19329_13870 [Legionella antarctica]
MKNKIVSFFFLGTNCHRSSYQDALTNFYRATKKNGISARLFDGVGSNPEHLSDKHPTPGQYVYDADQNKKIKISSKTSQNINDLMKRLTGCLAGDGMDDLLFESILYLEKLIKNNGGVMPDTVNLHGFSRGADACVRLANLIDTMYPEVKVNLFLIDHVPGPGRRDHPSSYTIPRNVQRFESVLMLHEYTPGFDPQDRNRYVLASPHTTKVSIKVYPGWHGKAMLLTLDEKTNHVPRLLHDDLYNFAQETGGLNDGAPLPAYKVMHSWTHYEDKEAHALGPYQRFHEYSGMQENWWFYSKGTQLNTRDVLNNHAHYSQDYQLFVNQEHGELFQQLFPVLYDRFLNNDTLKTSQEKVYDQLDLLEEVSSDFFYKKFCELCSIKKGEPLPASRRVASSFQTPLRDVTVKDELTFLKHSIVSIINFNLHHSKEYTINTRVAIKYLQNALKIAENMDSKEQSIITLRGAIYSVSKHLSHSESATSYMAQQLRKLSVGPKEFINTVDKLLEEHFDNNPELHEEQRNYLIEVREELQQIKNNDSFDYFQKQKAIRSVISSAAVNLVNFQANDSVLIHNLPDESDHVKSNLPTFQQLITTLNTLSAPGYSQTSIASDIGKEFNAYYKRNLFWDTVNRILSAVMPISLPPFVSPQKSDLAKKIYEELAVLDQAGQGNNLAAVSKVLTVGQQSLQEIYIINKKMAKGDFDNIMEKSQGKLNFEISQFPFESISSMNPMGN